MMAPDRQGAALMTGERLYLRLLEPEDASILARASHLESEVAFSRGGRVPSTALSFAHWIEQMNREEPPSSLVFAICRSEDDACIGTTSIRDIDWVHRTGETGIGLFNVEDRGRGLGPEAKHLLLRYCFEGLGLHAIRSFVYSGNTRSVRALRSQGYCYAGRITAYSQVKGVYRDELVFDLLRADWEAAYARWRTS